MSKPAVTAFPGFMARSVIEAIRDGESFRILETTAGSVRGVLSLLGQGADVEVPKGHRRAVVMVSRGQWRATVRALSLPGIGPIDMNGPNRTFAGCLGAALQIHQTGRSPQWYIQVHNRKSEEVMKALRQQ